MLFQAPPPPPPPPPVPPVEQRVLRRESGTVIVADNDRALIIQKPPAAESVVVRQRLLLRHTLTELAVSEGFGRDRGSCRWEIASYMQRDLCFTSITGLTGCTASVSDRLAQEASGAFDPTPPPVEGDPPPAAAPRVCAFSSGLLAAAVADAQARLNDRRDVLFEKDFAVHVRPLLTRTGATLKAR